jgi:two-component system CheB/CheR fusion protein
MPSGRPSLLLIDDDPHVVETLAELLGLEGFQVATALDGESGLCRAREVQPQLVLCDLTMRGGMDGYAFARACRADPSLRELRLIAVSGYCRPEDRNQAIAAGFDGLIGKPVDINQVCAALSPHGAAA